MHQNERSHGMKRMNKIGLAIFLMLLSLVLLSYLFQNKLVFQSQQLPLDYTFELNQPYEQHFISTPDNHTLHALWFKTAKPAKGLIIYFHGNANNLQRWGQYATDFTELGYEVLMMDYRGYGKSSGTPDEKTLYEDAALIYNWAKENSTHHQVIIYGRSMGAAIATHLAADKQPELLILETPFDELKGASILRYVFAIVPLHTKFATKEFIDDVKGKIIIFHGTDDWVVSLKSAERLKPFLKETDEFIVIEGGGHRNLREFNLYHTKLAAVLP